MVIVGTGVMASAALFQACTNQNGTASHLTVATMLAENIREAMAGLPFSDPVTNTASFGPEAGETTLASFNDADDFDGQTLNPPIDATRAKLPQLSQYTQKISVMPVDPNSPGGNTDELHPTITKGTYTGAVRVRVHILYSPTPTSPATEVYAASWVRADN
jgi:hypothetical protein